MRRWFAVLLLVLLPLQFSWAAVADYCGHETDAAADHLGHHDHPSHDDAGEVSGPVDEDQTDGTSSDASSLDCDHCHGYCFGTLDTLSTLEPQVPGRAPPSLGDTTLAEHVPAQPERPKWVLLA
jgi:hypothetical protein